MKKIFISSMLVILVIFSFISGRFEKKYNVRRDLSVYFSNSDEVINSVRNSLRKRSWRIVINYYSHGDNMEDIPALVKDIMDFALEETDNPAEGDYINYNYGGYELKYSFKQENDRNYYTVCIYPDYYTTAEQENQVSEKINQVISGFDKNISDYEKVREVYDYIKNRVQFDDIHKNNPNHHIKSTSFGAIIYGQAVCQGYAVLMYRMLREIGIDSRVITGMAKDDENEEFHAWNIACIDGVYYNIDITWDDQNNNEEYFLKSDEDFPLHIRDEKFSSQDFYEKYPMCDKSYER
ncbi:MAG: lasso peptide biosynthesis protein [Ruminococcus sp.]|nr:lasso peptide biosynthesis protein [Ruminococcus sp.]